MNDQRQADVAETVRLIDRAEREGSVRLPELSEADLCVLGINRQSLVDEQLVLWWDGMLAARRDAVTTRSLAVLASRGLLRPDKVDQSTALGRDFTARAHPALGIILTARARPSLLVVSSAGSQSARFDPRGYGVAEDGRGLRVVLVETVTQKVVPPLGQQVDYGLVSPARAGLLFARWAEFPVRRQGLARRRPPRLVDVYRNREGEGLARQRFITEAASGGGGLLVSCEGPDCPLLPPQPCNAEAFADVLARAMTGGRG